MGSTTKTRVEVDRPEWGENFVDKRKAQAEKALDIFNKTQSKWDNPQAGTWQNQVNDSAAGRYLKDGDPYFKNRLENQINNMHDSVNRVFAGAGRYGSGAHTGALAEGENRLRLEGLNSDYDRAFNAMKNDQRFKFMGDMQFHNGATSPFDALVSRYAGTTTMEDKDALSNIMALAGYGAQIAKAFV